MSAAASSCGLACSLMMVPKTCTPGFGPEGAVSNQARAWQVRSDQADFLFFLSSSTSVNSASTTSSFLPDPSSPPAPPDGPPGPPAAACSCACLYMASPSFIEAWASALVLAVMASASSPFKASLRSAIAFSIPRRCVGRCAAPAGRKATARDDYPSGGVNRPRDCRVNAANGPHLRHSNCKELFRSAAGLRPGWNSGARRGTRRACGPDAERERVGGRHCNLSHRGAPVY